MAKAITLKGFDQYAKKLQNASNGLAVEVDLEADATSQNVASRARLKAPLNDGTLRASIQPEKIRDGVYSVQAAANYAAYVEFGTRRRASVPADLQEYASQFKGSTGRSSEEAKAAIYEWCRKQGIPEERWWGIFMSLMTNGMRPHPFLFNSLDEEEPLFFKRLQAILDDI